jgi:RNA polymerase sigma factor (TIGR02999 family)
MLAEADCPLDPGSVTHLLDQWRSGETSALSDLVPYIYQELHQLAASCLRHERSDHTLQPTALVHEVYLRLAGSAAPNVQNRQHFYAIAARLMRQILVDHARRHTADKRGSGTIALSLDEAVSYSEMRAAEFTALDQALDRLAAIDERKARAVELRFFTGLSMAETADVLGTSVVSVHRDLRFATAFLAGQLEA